MHGEAVLEAVRAAGVLRHVAAHRADHLAGRVRGVEVAVRPGRGADRQVRDARFHDGPLADRVDRDDPAHPRGHDQHAVGPRQGAAGQAGARPPGHERHPGPGALRDHRRDLLRRLGQHDQAGSGAVRGEPVAFVGAQLSRIRHHAARPADLRHPGHHRLDRHPASTLALPALGGPHCAARTGAAQIGAALAGALLARTFQGASWRPGSPRGRRLRHFLVRGQGEEFRVVIGQRDRAEQPGRLLEAGRVERGTGRVPDRRRLLADDPLGEFPGHQLAVVQADAVVDPLPDL